MNRAESAVTAPSDARLYTAFCMLGKVPEAFGILTYAANRLRGRRAGIIEYKTATAPAVARSNASRRARAPPD